MTMAPRRRFIPGVSHHIRHRGNNRCDVFTDDNDRLQFLALLGKCARQRGVAIHGYVLMTTHMHAVLTGSDAESVPRMMQSLGRSYVRYFNEKHRRTGTLWEGRYWAGLIHDERYWLTCLRYVEMNPVAARMVSSPEAYPWSSYHAHAGGRSDALLTLHPLYLQLGSDAASRSANWAAICGQPIAETDLAEIRTATRRGTSVGRSDRADQSDGHGRRSDRDGTLNRDSEQCNEGHVRASS
jgi:putative transposase